MSIEFDCPNCQQTLRVPDETAGQKAECPSCSQIVDVPAADVGQWHVRSPDGEEFGPVAKSELDQWMAEGRLSPEFRLRHEGTAAWQSVTRLYPSILGETTAAMPSGHGASPSENPYASPDATTSQTRITPYHKEHRGGTILTFAILGLLCCFPFGIAAWIMGTTDLAEMKAGRMDSSGEGITRVGQIIGIVSVAVVVLGILGRAGLGLMNR